jgi:hypothetical protein
MEWIMGGKVSDILQFSNLILYRSEHYLQRARVYHFRLLRCRQDVYISFVFPFRSHYSISLEIDDFPPFHLLPLEVIWQPFAVLVARTIRVES